MAEKRLTNLTSGTDLKGTIKFGEAMRIDGNFEGELITDNGELVVGKTGNVKATVNARSAVIEGRVDGNIKASDRVELKQDAHFIGELQAKTLVMGKGVKAKNQSYKKVINIKTREERVKEITFNRFIDV